MPDIAVGSCPSCVIGAIVPDSIEVARNSRNHIATFEYDEQQRMKAKRETGMNYSGHFATTTRYEHQCR